MTDTRGTDGLPSQSVRATARQALLTGFALTIPLIVTLLVIGVVVTSLSNVLDPVTPMATIANRPRGPARRTASRPTPTT